MKINDEENLPEFESHFFEKLLEEWLEKGGADDALEFAKWLDFSLDETFN